MSDWIGMLGWALFGSVLVTNWFLRRELRAMENSVEALCRSNERYRKAMGGS